MEWKSIVIDLASRFWFFFNGDFLLQMFATLIGALLAFFFGLRLYGRQKRCENEATLYFLIASFSSILNTLYVLLTLLV